ncbi:MAG TPA: hypothetical protein VKA08_05905 [Balneolales bacterium]|nr:hypothetical protein [Balneolales bacterium]
MFWPKNNSDNNQPVKYARLFGFTYGHIAFAAFLIAAVSGVLLAIPFDIKDPLDSLSFMLLTNPGGVLFRNIHYWSAQVFLVFSILHIYDHLSKSTERKVKPGVWYRLTFSLLVIFFVMISGFIIKGDVDSVQAKRIITSLTGYFPLIGKDISLSLFGSANNHQILYIHHIATATIFLWIIIVEHAKTIWPKLRVVLYLLPLLIFAGYLAPPALHDGLSPVIKGPWYFLGLQEILHWMSYPVLIILLVLVFIFVVALLPKYSMKWSVITKRIMLGFFAVYTVLIIVGYFFRGEDWRFTLPWKNPVVTNYQFKLIDNIRSISDAEQANVKIPKVLGRREGCLTCHQNTTGFSPAHNPEAIGCTSCHLGDPFTLDKASAHKGMVLVPGNLGVAKQTCGRSGCHGEVVDRVDKTLMTTLSGIVSVDRYAFGETKDLNKFHLITEIGDSPADRHLRNLCASCHLGNMKTEFGPISQLSRGGGCNACHLNYSDSALASLSVYEKNPARIEEVSFTHPSLSLEITNDHCFGCHSRSGRISTNYEGWHDTLLKPGDVKDSSDVRVLDDGRIFLKAQQDIHHENGMACIDCHTSHEVMGDGNLYMHEEDQVKVSCIDCHFTGKPETKTISQVDQESQLIIYLRKLNQKNRKYLVVKKSGFPLINTYINEEGKPELITKIDDKALPLKPPAPICVEGAAHKELSCKSCHTSWATQCVSCHTQYHPGETGYDLLDNKEVKGDWVEAAADYLVEAPTLGIRIEKEANDSVKNIVDTFIPGMILELHKKDLDPKSLANKNMIFRRLFAPTSAHTITKEGRSCESCHNNPVALGYGRGKLEYVKQGEFGKWTFTPTFPLVTYDGLPEDAWIGFLKTRKEYVATRTNVRPFTVAEQKKILTVGACLTCHKPESRPMKEYLDTGKMPKVSSKCLLPVWN